MMISVRSARSRYSQYLADKKECEVKERAQMKRKAELDGIEELRMKTKRLKSDIDALHISVNMPKSVRQLVISHTLLNQTA